MKRSPLRAYLHGAGLAILVVTAVAGGMALFGIAIHAVFGVAAWVAGSPDWGYLWTTIKAYAFFFGCLWAIGVSCAVIATIPAVPRFARWLRAGARKSKDSLLHRRRIPRSGRTSNLRDFATLGSLGRAGRSAVHRALRPPPPPIWPEKPRWFGLAVRALRRFGRALRRFAGSFTSMLWKSVTLVVGIILPWEYAREAGLIPREFYTTVLPWLAIPAALLASLSAGLYRARYPKRLTEPVLLVGAVNPRAGTATAPVDQSTKDGLLRAHYDRPNRKEIEVGVRSALELHADGSVSPCKELCGIQKVQCTPVKARSVLDLERVVLICQRKSRSELKLVDRLAHFAAKHGVQPNRS